MAYRRLCADSGNGIAPEPGQKSGSPLVRLHGDGDGPKHRLGLTTYSTIARAHGRRRLSLRNPGRRNDRRDQQPDPAGIRKTFTSNKPVDGTPYVEARCPLSLNLAVFTGKNASSPDINTAF